MYIFVYVSYLCVYICIHKIYKRIYQWVISDRWGVQVLFKKNLDWIF